MTHAIDPNKSIAIRSVEDLERIASFFFRSGIFGKLKNVEHAFVLIYAGFNLGLDPLTSVTNLHLVEGKITMDATLIGAIIQRSGIYSYTIVESNDVTCKIDFFRESEKLGRAEYTIEKATKAGLAQKDTWRKHPQQMLRARCMTTGARFYTPAIFLGPIYTPDEIATDDDVIVPLETEAEPPAAPIALSATPTTTTPKAVTAIATDAPQSAEVTLPATDAKRLQPEPAAKPHAVAPLHAATKPEPKPVDDNYILNLVVRFNSLVEPERVIKYPLPLLSEKGIIPDGATALNDAQRRQAVALFESMILAEERKGHRSAPRKLGAPAHEAA
jgi:hypothetical protein